MSFDEILLIVVAVLLVSLISVVAYYRVKCDTVKMIAKLMAIAGKTYMDEDSIMEFVVDTLYELIPNGANIFVSKTKVEKYAKDVFDDVRLYAVEYTKHIFEFNDI